jgi:hypothetical protein
MHSMAAFKQASDHTGAPRFDSNSMRSFTISHDLAA